MSLIRPRNKNRNRELSLEEKQKITKNQLIALITQCFEQMQNTHLKGIKIVKNNSLGLTEVEVLAGLGDQALELVRLGTLLKDVLNLAQPGTVTEDGNPYK